MEIDAEKLIVAVEKRPALYNYLLKEHHLKDVIEKLWDEVAREVSAVAGANCKTKWTVLRGSYARYVREVKKLPSGSAASKRKKWYLADSMSFMHSFVRQHRKSKGNVLADDDDEKSVSASLEDEMTEESIDETSEGTSSSTPRTNDPHGKPDTRSDFEYPETSKKRETMSASDMVAGPMIEFLKKINQQLTPSADQNLKFFESLIPDIEKLSSKRIRIFKFKVMGFLNDLLDDQEHEDSANSSTPTPPVEQTFKTETEGDGYEDMNC